MFDGGSGQWVSMAEACVILATYSKNVHRLVDLRQVGVRLLDGRIGSRRFYRPDLERIRARSIVPAIPDEPSAATAV